MNDNSKEEKKKIPVKDLLQFYQDLEGRFIYHKCKADQHVKTFKRVGFIFGMLIPILSAFLTYAINAENIIPKQFSALLALALTLLTIVNSTLKPEERFSLSAQLGIELNDWKRDFDIRIANLNQKNNEDKSFLEIITEMDQRLSQIGKKMAENWVPKIDGKKNE